MPDSLRSSGNRFRKIKLLLRLPELQQVLSASGACSGRIEAERRTGGLKINQKISNN